MVAGICFSLTVAIGVGYEVYEFFGKTVFLTIDQGGYLNTASDLVSNLMGASVGTLFALFYDPLNAGVPSVSATPLPWQASLTLITTHPKKNAQKLAMFTRGNAMSTAPICSGTT